MTRALLRHPLFWILAAAAGLRMAGLFWGLPASDGWDDDGFVPRNFLTALALTYKHGSYFTYPPLHAIQISSSCTGVSTRVKCRVMSLSRVCAAEWATGASRQCLPVRIPGSRKVRGL